MTNSRRGAGTSSARPNWLFALTVPTSGSELCKSCTLADSAGRRLAGDHRTPRLRLLLSGLIAAWLAGFPGFALAQMSPGSKIGQSGDRTMPSAKTPMEHPAASPPFYREPTFLVLVGVTASAVGFAAYRLTRSSWRRRRGPASFVTEAVLVVDLVHSTHLATHYGDGLAMRARTVLKDRILAAAEPHGIVFAENTGDGYFMTFPSVAGAVRAAIALLKGLRDRPPDLSPGPPLEVRAAISYGEILLDARGVRHGAVINRAFRLEGLSRESFARVEGGVDPDGIPERNRILLDEDSAQEARAAGIPLRFLGFSSLKGFSGLHGVYEAPWETGQEGAGWQG